MAFSKKTWKDRSVQHPNRRTLTDTTSGTVQTVDVARAEGEISEAGDAFSAANMNDLESRIANALNEGLFMGKMTSVTSTTQDGVIDTNIDLHRDPKAGDRILVYIGQKVTMPASIKIYNNGTAVTVSFGIVFSGFYLQDLCILKIQEGIPSGITASLVQRVEITAYTAGDGISISNSQISNSKPQNGENIIGYNITSNFYDGNLGNFSRKADYVLINFKAEGTPNSDGYYTATASQSTPVAITSYYILKDMAGNNYSKNIYPGMSLLCKMKNEGGSGTSANPYYMTVVAENNWYVQIGAATGTTPGYCATIEGQGNEVTGERGHGEGYQNTASGTCSHVEGWGNTASGHNSHAGGAGSTASGERAFAHGNGLQAAQDNQFVVGQYNDNKANTLFEVGNGEYGNRSNALEVKSNGNVVAGNDIVDGNGYTLSSIVDAISEEKTVSGNPITLTDALPYNAVSLSAEIEPIQDLHGQSAPYVGGAGKNKLPMTVSGIKALNTVGTWSGNIYTWNGNTFEILTDSANNVLGIKVGGTNNGTACRFQVCNEGFIGDGSYYLNGSSTEFSGGQTQLYTKYSATNYAVSYNGADTPFTVSGGYTIGSVYILVDANISFSSPITYKPMIRLSTESDASYAPYSNICPISGHTSVTITDVDAESQTATVTVQLGQTVYGGTLNVTTGVLTVTWAVETFDGSNDENWELSSSGKRVYTNNLASVIKAPASGGIVANIISNEFKATSGNDTYAGNIGVSVDTTGLLGVSDGTGSMSPSAFKTWLTSNPLQVCYELATPTTIQLTPEQLTMLKGYNRLSSDGGGDITLTYKADRLAAIEAALAAL